MSKVYSDATAALAGLLRDNMMIAAGGFGLCGIPENLIAALHASGAKGLTIVNTTNAPRGVRPLPAAAAPHRAAIRSPIVHRCPYCTAGPDGTFQMSLPLPSSLRAGKYPVVAQCGATLSALVDVRRPRSIRTAVVLALAAVAVLLAGAAVGWFTRGRRGSAST